jgi:hypothetical protein
MLYLIKMFKITFMCLFGKLLPLFLSFNTFVQATLHSDIYIYINVMGFMPAIVLLSIQKCYAIFLEVRVSVLVAVNVLVIK